MNTRPLFFRPDSEVYSFGTFWYKEDKRRIKEDGSLIVLDKVSKSYSTGAPALNGVNLRIKKGEFVFIVGDSGSGKSTLIKLLLRELTPTSGTILVNGQNVADLNRARSRGTGEIWGSFFRISVC